MTIEERLRRALHTEASGVEADPEAWSAVQQEVARRRRSRYRQRAGAGALALAAMIAIAVGLVAVVGDSGQHVDVGPPAGTDTSLPTVTMWTAPPSDAYPVIWPAPEQFRHLLGHRSELTESAFTAESPALEFARAYLGMPDPQTADVKLEANGGDGAAVSVRPKPDAPMTTRIELRRFGGENGLYAVVGATTDNIQVASPASGDVVAGEVRVAGRSTAFEATARVEVRQDGQTFGERLGQSYVMGGSMGEMGPFEGTVGFDAPTEPAGAVVFYTDSAEDGSVQEATVVRIAFSDEEPTSFSVFFHRGEALVEIERTVSHTTGVLRAALTSLFQGPRPQDGDVSSFFSAQTAGLLRDVNLREDGTAVVDLAGTVPNANTSAGSQAFLASLNATVFQFPAVERVEYRLEGSCDAFWEWLQYGECQVVPRP